MHNCQPGFWRLFADGAMVFLAKENASSRLITAITPVSTGNTYRAAAMHSAIDMAKLNGIDPKALSHQSDRRTTGLPCITSIQNPPDSYT
jgi:hypothetical protein